MLKLATLIVLCQILYFINTNFNVVSAYFKVLKKNRLPIINTLVA